MAAGSLSAQAADFEIENDTDCDFDINVEAHHSANCMIDAISFFSACTNPGCTVTYSSGCDCSETFRFQINDGGGWSNWVDICAVNSDSYVTSTGCGTVDFIISDGELGLIVP